MTTKRQKAAIQFCEEIIDGVKFDGDINNSRQVSEFLSMYLETAESMLEDLFPDCEVINASAKTGTCTLVEVNSRRKHIVKLDSWNWRNPFAAEIFFTFKGKKFNVVCDMEPDYCL